MTSKAIESLDVHLRCPLCDYTWHAASIRTGAWWAKGATQENTARVCYCPKCNHAPPMVVG